MRITPQEALAELKRHGGRPFAELFAHGTLTLEIYKPSGVDRQTPHSRDEAYVVISGSGTFAKAGIRSPFKAGDLLFVPAGVEHRFEGFTDDFATWVIFYGPDGGEVRET
jgi:mannose-6-phosphate isomerase-like protein (cupin superfamily)